MTVRRDPQLLKGVLPMLILAELARESTYGRELVQRLEASGLEDLSHGTVYPLLTRLEREGLVDYQLVASPSGPARKIYSVTPQGAAKLNESVAAWRSLGTVVDTILA
ncbi:PadR family transcriptional regulator [Timonella senegalensis]|uniref:PadR family transcriptional regulator n=1 Tax=Timonella senegalensis TaxID=1465825 RepID=UPI002FDE4A41